MIAAQAQVQQRLLLLAVELAQTLAEQGEALAISFGSRIVQGQNRLDVSLDMDDERVRGEIAEPALLAIAGGHDETEKPGPIGNGIGKLSATRSRLRTAD